VPIDTELVRQVVEGRLTPQPGDPEAAKREAEDFFFAIVARVGWDQAREIFLAIGRPAPPEVVRQCQNEDLIELYNLQGPDKKSVWEFAGQIAFANRMLPRKSRMGPRGSTSHDTIYRHLKRLLKKSGKSKNPDGRTGHSDK